MANYCMIRFGKVKKNGLAKVQQHNNQKKEHQEALAKANEDFHPENVKYNISLKSSDHYLADAKEILEKEGVLKDGLINGKKPRKDANWTVESVVVYSPEMTPNLLCYLHREHKKWKEEHKDMWEAYCQLSPEEQRANANKERQWVKSYMEDAVKWNEKNIGPTISAEIHFSETTPHLHIVSVPLFEKKNGEKTLSAKDVLGGGKALSNKQTAFAKEVGEKYGLQRGEPKGLEEQKKRKSKFEWEIERLKNALSNKENQLKDTEDALKNKTVELAERTAELTRVNNEKKNAEAELDDVNNQLKLTQTAIEELQRASDLFLKLYEEKLLKIEIRASEEKQKKIDELKGNFHKEKDNILEMIKSGKISPIVVGSIQNLTKPVEQFIKEEEDCERDF